MAFEKKAFFSMSRRKLLKRPSVSYSLHVDPLRLRSLKKFYESVSEKTGLEYFATKNLIFNLLSINLSISVTS